MKAFYILMVVTDLFIGPYLNGTIGAILIIAGMLLTLFTGKSKKSQPPGNTTPGVGTE